MQIKIVKLKGGERYPFLMNEEGVPDFWVTHFVTQKLRMSLALTSITQYLKNIRHLKKWEIINGRDLLEEIYEGKVPTRDDIKSICDHCYYQAKALELPKKSSSKNRVIDMSKFTLLKDVDLPTIGGDQYITRLAHISEFLYFIGKERVKLKPSAASLFDELDEMKKEFKRNRPKGRLKRKQTDKSGIPDDVFEDFVAVAKYYSKHNPFKDSNVRYRNYLIVRVLHETGFRCSELLTLRENDIDWDADMAKLEVRRDHDRETDPRANEPNAKTLGRSVRISKELREELSHYIDFIRTKTKTAHTHPYIFVSHKSKKGHYESGRPITQQTITDLYNRIKKVNPERFWGITPHLFRHYFNDQLSIRIDKIRQDTLQEVARLEQAGQYEAAKLYAKEHTISEQQELEIRAEMNGHSSLDSGRTYLKRTIVSKAQRINEALLEMLNQKVEGANYA